jgi:hypothetical protein
LIILSRFVAALATLTALIAASVPELTNRTRSIEGISMATRWASRVSSSVGAPKLVPFAAVVASRFNKPLGAWPWMRGPHDITKSMYSWPSASSMCAPRPRTMKSGVAPTAANARTGLSTPPGRMREAAANNFSDRG